MFLRGSYSFSCFRPREMDADHQQTKGEWGYPIGSAPRLDARGNESGKAERPR